MPIAVTRFGIPLMLLAGLAGIVYVLMQSASPVRDSAGVERFATGTLRKLMVAGESAEVGGINFTGPDGAAVSLADFEGRVVLVNLWGIFCPPCVKEMPTLATLQREMGSERFVVLAVSVDPVPDTEASRTRLAELSDGALSFYHDPGYGLVYGFGARGFPTTFLIGADGREIARLEGEADWASEEARGLIAWAVEGGTKKD